jgi:predicted nucleic acid-binding protein
LSAAYVADASVALAWVLASQAVPATDKLLEGIAGGVSFAVPSIWPIEVANALLLMMRRRKISRDEYLRARVFVESFRASVDDMGMRTTAGIAELAEEHGLTVYDAAYLELAIRTQLPLASKDSDLNKAARRCGVPLLV